MSQKSYSIFFLIVYTPNILIFFYSLSKEVLHLTSKDPIAGIIVTNALYYLLLIAKTYLWYCRRTQILIYEGFDLRNKALITSKRKYSINWWEEYKTRVCNWRHKCLFFKWNKYRKTLTKSIRLSVSRSVCQPVSQRITRNISIIKLESAS